MNIVNPVASPELARINALEGQLAVKTSLFNHKYVLCAAYDVGGKNEAVPESIHATNWLIIAVFFYVYTSLAFQGASILYGQALAQQSFQSLSTDLDTIEAALVNRYKNIRDISKDSELESSQFIDSVREIAKIRFFINRFCVSHSLEALSNSKEKVKIEEIAQKQQNFARDAKIIKSLLTELNSPKSAQAQLDLCNQLRLNLSSFNINSATQSQWKKLLNIAIKDVIRKANHRLQNGSVDFKKYVEYVALHQQIANTNVLVGAFNSTHALYNEMTTLLKATRTQILNPLNLDLTASRSAFKEGYDLAVENAKHLSKAINQSQAISTAERNAIINRFRNIEDIAENGSIRDADREQLILESSEKMGMAFQRINHTLELSIRDLERSIAREEEVNVVSVNKHQRDVEELEIDLAHKNELIRKELSAWLESFESAFAKKVELLQKKMDEAIKASLPLAMQESLHQAKAHLEEIRKQMINPNLSSGDLVLLKQAEASQLLVVETSQKQFDAALKKAKLPQDLVAQLAAAKKELGMIQRQIELGKPDLSNPDLSTIDRKKKRNAALKELKRLFKDGLEPFLIQLRLDVNYAEAMVCHQAFIDAFVRNVPGHLEASVENMVDQFRQKKEQIEKESAKSAENEPSAWDGISELASTSFGYLTSWISEPAKKSMKDDVANLTTAVSKGAKWVADNLLAEQTEIQRAQEALLSSLWNRTADRAAKPSNIAKKIEQAEADLIDLQNGTRIRELENQVKKLTDAQQKIPDLQRDAEAFAYDDSVRQQQVSQDIGRLRLQKLEQQRLGGNIAAIDRMFVEMAEHQARSLSETASLSQFIANATSTLKEMRSQKKGVNPALNQVEGKKEDS